LPSGLGFRVWHKAPPATLAQQKMCANQAKKFFDDWLPEAVKGSN